MNWFEELAPLLAESHRVIRIDLLGHGGSDKPRSGYAISDQANADRRGARRARTSATRPSSATRSARTVATALAEQSPELADQDRQHRPGARRQLRGPLVHGQARHRAGDRAGDEARHRHRAHLGGPQPVPAGLRPGLQHRQRLREPRPGGRGPRRDDLHGLRRRRWTRRATTRTPAPSTTASARSEIPVLVIFGAEDQIYDADAAIEPFEDIAGVQTELIEGAGHSPNVEIPERIAAADQRVRRRSRRRRRRRRRRPRRSERRRKPRRRRRGSELRPNGKTRLGRESVRRRRARPANDPLHDSRRQMPGKTKGPVTRALRLGPALRPSRGSALRLSPWFRLAASPWIALRLSGPDWSCD